VFGLLSAVSSAVQDMAAVAVAFPRQDSPGGEGPMKSETPSVQPPSPSVPLSMFAPQPSAVPLYERQQSGGSEKDEHGRSQSTPMNHQVSTPPKRTNSAGTLPPFLASTANLSPPSFHPSNHRNTSPESRRTRSSENMALGDSSPDSSPQQHPATLGGTSYHNSQHLGIRSSDHQMYSNQDYDAMMRPKKRHKTSRACDECRRKKVFLQYLSLIIRSVAMQRPKRMWNNVHPAKEPVSTVHSVEFP